MAAAAREVERLKVLEERNKNWQSVSAKFKNANTDLNYPMGPKGFILLRDDGTLDIAFGKQGKTARLTYDGAKITRKNI